MATRLLTIGHSNHSFDAFVTLLRRHGVTAVADVRSAPHSRFTPHFNKDLLQNGLRAAGIKYVFLGRELGARSKDPACYENGRVQYDRLAQSDLFRAGIERLLRGATEHSVAIMCAEKEPLECHRTLLVSRALVAQGVFVNHVHADGRAETHAEAMNRLLDVVGLPRQDLFRSPEELLSEAMRRQEVRIAYVDTDIVAVANGNAL